jgi:hypothetical protein
MSEPYSDPYDNKNSAEIQRDIDHTRAEMSETLEALRGRLSPGELFEQAISYVKEGGASEFTSNLGDTIKHNPVPTALIGIGLAWLMMGDSRRTASPSPSSCLRRVGRWALSAILTTPSSKPMPPIYSRWLA